MKQKMIKGLLVAAVATTGLLLLGQSASEAGSVAGACVGCHTMHNSQDGSNMTSVAGSTAAQDYLLRQNCIGCHTGPIGTARNNLTAPIVIHTSPPTGNASAAPQGTNANNYLAGGSFTFVTSSGDAYGHNVAGHDTQDSPLALNPPGGDALAAQLECAGAGTTGCHKGGGHHNNQGGDFATGTYGWVDGSDVGNSYRFLSGIQGGEDSDWEYTFSMTNHNTYFAEDNDSQNSTVDDTITFFCAKCHGKFHGAIDSPSSGDGTGGGSTPWVRHPTDLSLYGLANTAYQAYNTYDPLTPVGASGATGQVLADGLADSQAVAIVVCQSCHRAHGSQYMDLLRFSYAQMDAGTDTDASWLTAAGNTRGCFKCHTDKDQ